MQQIRRILSNCKLLLLLWFPLMFQSCDPAKVLIVKTSGRPNSSVTIHANKHFLPLSKDFDQDKIVIKIPATPTDLQKGTLLYYGFGGWADESRMAVFSKNIDSIIIESRNETIKLTNHADINNYLSKHRSGFGKRILTIAAK